VGNKIHIPHRKNRHRSPGLPLSPIQTASRLSRGGGGLVDGWRRRHRGGRCLRWHWTRNNLLQLRAPAPTLSKPPPGSRGVGVGCYSFAPCLGSRHFSFAVMPEWNNLQQSVSRSSSLTNRLPTVAGWGGVVDVCPLSIMDHGIRHNDIVQFPFRERSV
jgi:hypothetical protein